MTRKTKLLSPESAALIEHLKEFGNRTVVQLRPQFPDMTRAQLVKRLGNLVALGWLDFTWNNAGEKTWFVRPSARAIAVRTESAEPAETQEAVQVVVPRTFSVTSEPYKPPPGPALRPGALDFMRCPSVGFRC